MEKYIKPAGKTIRATGGNLMEVSGADVDPNHKTDDGWDAKPHPTTDIWK